MKLINTALVLSILTSSAHAFDWSSSNIQLLYGGDFELGDRDRTTVTVEHAHGWQYGSNFFRRYGQPQ
nr:hypothetical protein [Methylomarinum sp. Ch1-1]MDP4520564.1 hypothetical protein [Methylomarinum sp. Ch1-1]